MEPNTKEKFARWRTIMLTIVLFIFFFIEYGVMKSFGVIINDVVDQMDSDLSTVGLVFGTYHGISYFIGKKKKE